MKNVCKNGSCIDLSTEEILIFFTQFFTRLVEILTGNNEGLAEVLRRMNVTTFCVEKTKRKTEKTNGRGDSLIPLNTSTSYLVDNRLYIR